MPMSIQSKTFSLKDFYQNSQDLGPGQLKVDAPSEIVADEDSQGDSDAVSIIVMKLGWN